VRLDPRDKPGGGDSLVRYDQRAGNPERMQFIGQQGHRPEVELNPGEVVDQRHGEQPLFLKRRRSARCLAQACADFELRVSGPAPDCRARRGAAAVRAARREGNAEKEAELSGAGNRRGLRGRPGGGRRFRLRLRGLGAEPQHGYDEKQSDLNSAQRFLHSRPAGDGVSSMPANQGPSVAFR